MFGKKKEEVSFDKVDTLIGADTSVQGTITATGTIRIDGKLEGEINCAGDLVIGEGGKVKANIKVRNLLLSGELEGNVAVQGRIEITLSGKLYGDIATSNLVIDEGAVFRGKCDMQQFQPKGKVSLQPQKAEG
jgi:cytoskeletal protein CcmA (bactofilin family)